MVYRVSEIFLSIEGEGKRTGLPCTFVRLAGCNLRCSYCDTRYAMRSTDGERMSAEDIANRVRGLGAYRVTITGGEPMLQDAIGLARALVPFECNIETNGSVRLFERPSNAFYTMDWKSFSSGHAGDMVEENLDALTSDDVLKFVVGDDGDLEQMRDVLTRHDTAAQVFVSPVFGAMEPRRIVEYVLRNGLDVRVQVQLHKVIWEPDRRGV